MMHRTAARLRMPRKPTPYVRKFLEGCPLPETLVDDIAGANLKSMAPFFTTAPRYIVAAESRLSKLFFHHALYPAGGARRPCRVLIVRGGRSVREPSFTINTGGGRGEVGGGSRGYRDPARRAYFYARPSTVGPFYSGNGGVSSNVAKCHSGVGSEGAGLVKRASVDGLLSPLCGVIEAHFAVGGTCNDAVATEGDGTESLAKGGEKLCATLAGLLSGGHGGLMMDDGNCASNVRAAKRVARLLHDAAHHLSSFFYVHTQLPDSALFVSGPEASIASNGKGDGLLPSHLAREKDNDGRPSVEGVAVFRLAGGLEPTVHFAVGAPLSVLQRGVDGTASRGEKNSAEEGLNSAASTTVLPFGHIQCLLRVRTRGGKHCAVGKEGSEGASNTPWCNTAGNDDITSNFAASGPQIAGGIVEPWKLGVSLDPKVPFFMRTLTEKRPSFSCGEGNLGTCSRSGDVDGNTVNDVSSSSGGSRTRAPGEVHMNQLLVRNDCETYLLPQRELLLSFHVPEEAEAMCKEQNEERMRRQAALGYGSPSHVFAEGPRTFARVLHGMKANLAAVEEASSTFRQGAAEGISPQVNGGSTTSGSSRVYEVRALPGDVVFVPRGWKYSVERIVGTAIIDAVAASTASPREALRAVFRTAPDPPLPQDVVRCDEGHAGAGEMPGGDSGNAEIVGVEVDAFVLCYKPYPVLSNAQASTYVAANYVHSGIDDFYAKGGNDVYHKYT
ncbi:hypothetical protein, conserved [Trypanosoma brucei brucei TREU927]|uniref:Uncharacterized protein n=1 Tax=Trypanosoma brucei brucei (strain 927/4 GUTat10.1) TaxID=185431 RepID=Q57W22_TRYB2|nr:hypothetical protein, conserved [Trypanosoma brucei brucei TREU927]AAX70197.1 hypothetical protein, conserved [Trypanosoma brucei]AAZ11192.1 hypothetical protein, conserved [Trypanosoma brucei brucei TREU927]